MTDKTTAPAGVASSTELGLQPNGLDVRAVDPRNGAIPNALRSVRVA